MMAAAPAYIGLPIAEVIDPANAYEVYNTWAMSEDLLQFNQLFDQNKTQYYSEFGRQIYCQYPTVNSVIGATGTADSWAMPRHINTRVLIHNMNELWPKKFVETNIGRVEISESFQLVLGALKKHLNIRRDTVAFAIGARNKAA